MFSTGEIHTRPNSTRLYLLGAIRYLRKKLRKPRSFRIESVEIANRGTMKHKRITVGERELY